MHLFRSVGSLGSFVLVGMASLASLAGCSNAAREVSTNDAPVVQQVMLSTANPTRVGVVLQGSYQYSDSDGDAESGTLKAWLRDGQPIEGADQDSYTVTAQDSGKKLYYRVTPAAVSGKSPGAAVASSAITIENSEPSISGLTILGTVLSAASTSETYTGQVLTAAYVFNDVDLNREEGSRYQWLRDGKTISGAMQYSYTVTTADIDTAISVQVTPKDSENKIGASVVSPAVNVVNLAPVASNVRIIDAVGSTPAKRIVAALYDYADHEGDPSGTPLHTWKRNGVPVANTASYTLSLGDAGSVISVEVTAVALSGALQGVAIAATTGLNVPSVTVALNVSAGLKQLHFSWAAVLGASTYRVSTNPDGASGFVPVSTDSSNLVGTAYDWDISVHRINWPKAQFVLEACDSAGCLLSASISALSVMANAIGYYKASNTGVNDQFGYSVALSADSNTLAVGAPYEASAATGINNISPGQSDNTATNAGAVYVYTRSLGIWAQEAYVKAANNPAGKWFGWSVALNGTGNTLAVGAWADNAAYVFTRSAGVWIEQTYIKNPISSGFGLSVTLSSSGDTMAVGAKADSSAAIGVNTGNPVTDCGAPAPTNCAAYAGAVYVYTRSTAAVWTQQAYVKASNTAMNTTAQENFGSALALSGDGKTLAVGVGREGGAAIDGSEIHDCDALPPINCAKFSGAVYIFTFTLGGGWIQEAYIKASNIGTGDNFGGTVALTGDGNTLVVGASFESSAATGINGNEKHDCAAVPAVNCNGASGAVYIYARGAGKWTKQTYIKLPYGQSPFFPGSISISTDGNILVFGNGVDYSFGEGSGAIFVYTRSGTTWKPPSRIYSSNPGKSDNFGHSVSISGDGNTLAVGAYQEGSAATGVNNTEPGQGDNAAPGAGAVYLY